VQEGDLRAFRAFDTLARLGCEVVLWQSSRNAMDGGQTNATRACAATEGKRAQDGLRHDRHNTRSEEASSRGTSSAPSNG